MVPERALVILSLLLDLAFLMAAGNAQTTDVQRIRQQYLNKPLMLRGFYSGDSLRYDSSGRLAGNSTVGDWTTDGILQLNDVSLTDHVLTLEARRLVVVSRENEFQFLVNALQKRREKTPHLEITIEMESSQQADAALSRVFLTPQDVFAGLVPDYWKPCVSDGLINKSAKCHFSPELLAIPGVATRVERPSVSKAAGEAPPSISNNQVFRKGSGVSPPRPVITPEPKFTEVARKAKLSGVVTLGLVVDNTGWPIDVQILDPMGCGLDAEAVHTMETWRFEPAKKDGKPVAVKITVEMDFHRY